MARDYQTRSALLLTASLLLACSREAPPPRQPGRLCEALLHAAERASACDPQLAIADATDVSEFDEDRCHTAITSILHGIAPRIQTTSVYQPAQAAETLSDEQLAELEQLALPGSLRLRPDIPPGPGVPSTAAKLAGRTLATDDRGALQIHAPAGRHLLEIDYAGGHQAYCVRLAECQQLDLTVHGASIGNHPHIDAGTCEPPAQVAVQPNAGGPSLTRR